MFYEDEDFGLNKSVDYLENNCFSATGENCFQRFLWSFMVFLLIRLFSYYFAFFRLYNKFWPDHPDSGPGIWTAKKYSGRLSVRFGSRPGPVFKIWSWRLWLGYFGSENQYWSKPKNGLRKFTFPNLKIQWIYSKIKQWWIIKFYFSWVPSNLTWPRDPRTETPGGSRIPNLTNNPKVGFLLVFHSDNPIYESDCD